jgi:TolB-like protein/DNA-binding winged helix-turn-helix (wHTH) protein/Flp pilus assembly protein TadD
MSNDKIHLFADFALDLTRGFLLRGDELVHLRPQTYEVLKYLIENKGRLISKDKLIEEVWHGRAVTDGSLGKCVEELREALGDNAMTHVRNVRGRGYIFDPEANGGERIENTSEQIDVVRVVVVDEEKDSGSTYLAGTMRKHKLGFAVGLLVPLLAVVGLGYWLYAARAPKLPPIDSIAVLPFVNESDDPDVEYLSDGMTESLINSLSRLPRLSVKARNTVFRYKGKEVAPQIIAAELSVQAILNGRFVQHGDDLTLYLSLVDARTGNQLWGEQYNRKLTNLVLFQNEITRDVSQKLRARLSGAEEQKATKNYTANVEAYQLYLKGNYEWNKRSQEDLYKGIEYYSQALEKDPNYALAYQGLSGSYGVLGNAYLPPNENFPKAKAYAAKALAIDDTLAEAHVAMGGVRLLYDWDWAETEKEFKRAQTLDPNNADAHQMYAAYLEAMGRFDEALPEAKRAQELDPLSAMFSMEVGTTFYYARQYDEAIAQLEKTINLEPRYVEVYLYLGQTYEQKKMYAQAIATYQKGMTRAERHPFLIASLGHAYALAGERYKALKALAELREISKRQYVSPYLIAVVYAGLGDKDQTFAWLDKAYQDRSFFLIWLKVEPQFDSLLDDARYKDLLRRIGLQP